VVSFTSPAALPPESEAGCLLYVVYGMLGGPQSWSGRCGEGENIFSYPESKSCRPDCSLVTIVTDYTTIDIGAALPELKQLFPRSE
jgi:hypothetical protein